MSNAPLGLPEGSVRALIALTTAGGFVTICFLSISHQVPTETFAILGPVVMAVFKDYFGARERANKG